MYQARLAEVIARTGGIVLGKERQICLALTCVLARGHLLIEDLPGIGKTVLAHALARVLDLEFQRIQFTSDLLPADILGVSVYEQESRSFRFHPGPLFSQLILVDEINRATPKAQSALLEAMEERQITVEGVTRPLPEPFFVIATQNPAFQVGTFPLPESQLDRFLMRIEIGYPDAEAERRLLQGRERRELLRALAPVLDHDTLRGLQEMADRVHVSPALLDYLQAILEFSRTSSLYAVGLSPRAGLALLRSARAWACLHDRDHLLPEDLQAVLPCVAGHRLKARDPAGADARELVAELAAVPIP